jgi:hypothetical protein
MVLRCVTVASDRRLCWGLEKSCEECGVDLTVLGENEKWNGHCSKFELLLAWMREGKYDDDDFVLFTDGYDTFCQQLAAELEAVISTMPKDKLIVSAERYLWPPAVFDLKPLFKERAPTATASNLYPCCGQFAGSVKMLRAALDVPLCYKHDDDQAALVLFCAENPEKVKLDFDLRLFHPNIFLLENPASAYDGNVPKRYVLDRTLVVGKGGGSFPVLRQASSAPACFVHANGAPKWMLYEMIWNPYKQLKATAISFGRLCSIMAFFGLLLVTYAVLILGRTC